MRISEIISHQVELLELDRSDTEQYGNWIVTMSQKPVVMPKVTGPTAQFVALVKHARRKDLYFYGVGKTQGAARDDGIRKATASDRPEDPEQFRSFTADLNVDFTNEYLQADSVPFYKIQRDGEHLFLVQASKAFFREFGREITALGFNKASRRSPDTGGDTVAVPLYGFHLTKNLMRDLKIIPNMRYTLEYVHDDEDGNGMFLMTPDTRTMGPQDRYRMGRPGVTIAATMG